jgi:hypothetical protein
MPAKSKSQQRLFGMAYAYKKGESELSDFPEGIRDQIKRMADDMSLSKLKDYAETKHQGLPDEVQEGWRTTMSNKERLVRKVIREEIKRLLGKK